VRFIIEALNVDESKVAYVSYTGKAAEVLRKKGNKNAMTLHKLLYESRPLPNGKFIHIPRSFLEYDVIVVDEVSMVPSSMVKLLLRHPIYVIFLGDPGQLNPILKEDDNHLLDHPHVFLDEIMRQAAESEIIQLTMKIRNGENIGYYSGKEVMVIPKKELSTGHMLWANQIICATNVTRIALNNQMRQLLGYSGLPQSGERLICLRNYWDEFSDDEEMPLVNGSTGIIKNPFETFIFAPPTVKMRNHKIDVICADFITDEGTSFSSVLMDKHMIETEEPCLNWQESFALNKLKNKVGDIVPRQFTYGYVISGHKAQGSEFDKVLVIEEDFPFDKEEHKRWLYTAATRAASRLVLVR
jgi:exodeoxyribonuclease-5